MEKPKVSDYDNQPYGYIYELQKYCEYLEDKLDGSISENDKIKEGDYVYFHGEAYPEFITSFWYVGKVCKARRIDVDNENYSGSGVQIFSDDGGSNDYNNFRKATIKEIGKRG